jgi:hypothetical protein
MAGFAEWLKSILLCSAHITDYNPCTVNALAKHFAVIAEEPFSLTTAYTGVEIRLLLLRRATIAFAHRYILLLWFPDALIASADNCMFGHCVCWQFQNSFPLYYIMSRCRSRLIGRIVHDIIF